MKNLFIIDGAQGTGKIDLMAYFPNASNPKTICVNKYSTKPIDEKNPLDLRHLSEEDFNEKCKDKNFLNYTYGDKEIYQYGFYIEHINNALRENDNVFIVIRDIKCARLVKDLFKKDIQVTCVYIYTDVKKMMDRYMSEDKYTEKEAEDRAIRTGISLPDFISRYKTDYNEVLINISKADTFHKHLDKLIDSYKQEYRDCIDISPTHIYKLPKSLIGHKETIMGKITKNGFEKNIFLMMKYRDSNKLLYEEIKTMINSLGYNCICPREDDTEHNIEWSITGDIYNPIAVLYCCKYGIALFDKPESGNMFSPNVAYELGIMHQQKKKCGLIVNEILLKKEEGKESQMPFDLSVQLRDKYTDDLEVKNLVKKIIGEFNNSND